MRIRGQQVACAAALGLLTSVGVAWVLAVEHPGAWTWGGNDAWPVAGSEDWLIRSTGAGFGYSSRSYSLDRPAEVDAAAIHLYPRGLAEPGARWHATRATGDAPKEAIFVSMSNGQKVESSGLPFRCVQRIEWTSQAGCLIDTVAQRGGIPYGKYGESLPWLPEWAGLAGDTAVWGTPWLGLFVLVGRWRRIRREKRGLCPACGYALAGLPAGSACPECVAAARVRWRNTGTANPTNP